MKKIITISREFGCGGRVIGQAVAKELGYDFYDKEIIDLSAKESGLSADFIAKNEQSISSGWLYNLLLGSSYADAQMGSHAHAHSAQPAVLPLADQVFNAQRRTILSLAKKGPCVIVGRCADYILSTSREIDQSELLDVFIYADMDDKIKRAVAYYDIPEKDAKKVIQQRNKRRANHYNMFTEHVWGERAYYDLLVNSSVLGLDGTAQFIAQFARQA